MKKMRNIVGLLLVICIVLLTWISTMWSLLSGQIQAHFTSSAGNKLLSDLMKKWKESSAEFGIYAFGENDINNSEDVLLYECIAYHPDALGITIISGTSITPQQIAKGDQVAMLSEKIAVSLDPSMNCIGQEITIDGERYRVLGIYRNRSPLGFLSRLPGNSVVIPYRRNEETRILNLWIQAQEDSRFLYQEVHGALELLNQSKDFASFSVKDLGLAARLGRQNSLFWLWLDGALLSFTIFHRSRFRRKRFFRKAALQYRIFEFRIFLRKILPSMIVDLLPSVTFVVVALLVTVKLASGVVIDATVLPQRFLDINAWRNMFVSNVLQTNSAYFVPAFSYVICDRLNQLNRILGSFGLACLLLCLKKERNS